MINLSFGAINPRNPLWYIRLNLMWNIWTTLSKVWHLVVLILIFSLNKSTLITFEALDGFILSASLSCPMTSLHLVISSSYSKIIYMGGHTSLIAWLKYWCFPRLGTRCLKSIRNSLTSEISVLTCEIYAFVTCKEYHYLSSKLLDSWISTKSFHSPVFVEINTA